MQVRSSLASLFRSSGLFCVMLPVSVFLAFCPDSRAADTPTNMTMNLPGYVPFKVTKILFGSDPPKHVMGDGFACYIAEVADEDIARFLMVNAKLDPQWSSGSLAVRDKHLSVFEWLEKWMKAADVHDKIDAILDLKSLKKAERLSYRLEYKTNSDGDISDAKMWILLPERRIACVICMNT